VFHVSGTLKDKSVVESLTAHVPSCTHCLLTPCPLTPHSCPLTPRSRPPVRTTKLHAHASTPLSTQQTVRPPMIQLKVKLTQCSGRHCCSRRSRSTAVKQCRVLTGGFRCRERLFARDAPRYGAQRTSPRERAGVLAGRSREGRASTIVMRSRGLMRDGMLLSVDSCGFHGCGWVEVRCSGYRWARGVVGENSVIFLRYVVRSGASPGVAAQSLRNLWREPSEGLCRVTEYMKMSSGVERERERDKTETC
jgi:hypothetical protein